MSRRRAFPRNMSAKCYRFFSGQNDYRLTVWRIQSTDKVVWIVTARSLAYIRVCSRQRARVSLQQGLDRPLCSPRLSGTVLSTGRAGKLTQLQVNTNSVWCTTVVINRPTTKGAKKVCLLCCLCEFGLCKHSQCLNWIDTIGQVNRTAIGVFTLCAPPTLTHFNVKRECSSQTTYSTLDWFDCLCVCVCCNQRSELMNSVFFLFLCPNKTKKRHLWKVLIELEQTVFFLKTLVSIKLLANLIPTAWSAKTKGSISPRRSCSDTVH